MYCVLSVFFFKYTPKYTVEILTTKIRVFQTKCFILNERIEKNTINEHESVETRVRGRNIYN